MEGREGTLVREHSSQWFLEAVRGKAPVPLSLHA